MDTVVIRVLGTDVKQPSALENGFLITFKEAMTLEREREAEKRRREEKIGV